MTQVRQALCVIVALAVTVTPALAQQAQAPSPTSRTKFWTGALLGAAGGTAIVLGGTTLRTADATSGNTPPSGYASCVALMANPVYRANDCDVLKGPNKGVMIGGTLAAATGVALMMMGLSHNNSIAIGPAGVRVQHRVKF